jgi:mRNA-degrading endonuclease toxin of MazEF toxin-antitoxin module
MERGDIYLVSLDPTEGHQQRAGGLFLSYRPAPSTG